MEAKIGQFFESIASFFGKGGDQIPWCDRDIVVLPWPMPNPLYSRERAVGYYRIGEYPRSRQLVEQCLQIAPEWNQAWTLKKTVEDRIGKDGVIGIGISATAVGLIVGGTAAALARR